MTTQPPTGSDNSPVMNYKTPTGAQLCPLCRQRPIADGKRTYGHEVCKKCYYGFANRRQLGYVIDAILMTIINGGVGGIVGYLMGLRGFSMLQIQLAVLAPGIVLMCFYICKDGFNGQSPGKRLMGVQVLNNETNQPISFGQSFKRNSILLVSVIPFAGGFAALVIILVIAVNTAKGFRLGDKFAKTRVIWKKYAYSPVFGGDALVCEHCGYELQGNTSGICPECGQALSAENRGRLGVTNHPLTTEVPINS